MSITDAIHNHRDEDISWVGPSAKEKEKGLHQLSVSYHFHYYQISNF
jgi:hypothetical protein